MNVTGSGHLASGVPNLKPPETYHVDEAVRGRQGF
jgi:hypothetical protein